MHLKKKLSHQDLSFHGVDRVDGMQTSQSNQLAFILILSAMTNYFGNELFLFLPEKLRHEAHVDTEFGHGLNAALQPLRQLRADSIILVPPVDQQNTRIVVGVADSAAWGENDEGTLKETGETTWILNVGARNCSAFCLRIIFTYRLTG